MSSFSNLGSLGVKSQVTFHSMALNDFRSVLQFLAKVQADEIYNLAGQSSVGLSFDQPVETLECINIGTLNLLEVVRFYIFPAGENTPFRPRSFYAVAKATAFWEIANYRDAYNLFACTGILFNNESPLRPERFVTRKIIKAACRIASGSAEKLHLGNISIARDWGLASEYVEAMWLMLQQNAPEDFVIATGETNTLEEFVSEVFSFVGLDWHDHVVTDSSLLRPSEIMISRGNPE
jgi:GDPmannose 4,6-dehydratase